MQGIGCKEDTELNKEDLSLNWRELSVESVGHCQSLGKWRVFPVRFNDTGDDRHDTHLKKHTQQTRNGFDPNLG